jgi:IS605 OrfB family transposase
MLTLDYKLSGTPAQYAAIDEGIRTVQFLRNKCLRAWMDRLPVGTSKATMTAYTAVLAREFAFAGRLGSQARQASAERAWAAISRFYENCKNKIPGKKGYPQFQHDCRSLEYKETAGWRLAPDGKHITFSDGLGIGTLRLMGAHMGVDRNTGDKPLRSPAAYAPSSIKRVRIVRRADGYYCQFCLAVSRMTPHTPTGVERGIDVGLFAYVTDSEGTQVENPRYFRKAERRVKWLQRQVSRKSVHHKQSKQHQQKQRQQRPPRPVTAQQNRYPAGQPVVKPSPRSSPSHPQTLKLWHTRPKTGQTLRRQQRRQRQQHRQQRVLPAAQKVPLPQTNPHPEVEQPPRQPKPSQRLDPQKQAKQSQNYRKARQRLARAHLKVQRQREDFARKTASALVTSSDLIAYEHLQIRNLVYNHHLAKSISDAAWGRFLWWVQYYATMQRVPCLAVPPQYTSQDCSGILPDGMRCPERVVKSLSVRTHICPRCGLVMDRDQNAARLIKERALHLLAEHLLTVPSSSSDTSGDT